MKKFINDQEYFADKEYLTHSMIKDFISCEHYFRIKHIDKTFLDNEERDYFVFGSAVDSLLTESEGNFEERFMVLDRKIATDNVEELYNELKETERERDEKLEAGKPVKMLEAKIVKINEKLDKIKEAEGKTQISSTVFGHIHDSVKEMRRQPLYEMFGIGKGGTSQDIICAEINGVKRKGKLDHIDVKNKIIADVKTCADITKFDPRMYATQLYYYRKLASVHHKIDEQEWDCYITAVDKQTHYKRSEVFHLNKNIIDAAGLEIEAIIKQMEDAKALGFYTPATNMAGAEIEDARRNKCYKCNYYNECEFSLQKEISHIA